MKIISLILIIIGLLWIISIVIAPLTLEPGTVILGEDGGANHVDYPDLWIRLPLFQKIVYGLGDLICHQKTSRSFIINGNQMPVCARDVGLYLGILIALIPLYVLNIRCPIIYKRFISKLFGSKIKFLILYFIFSGPLIIDFSTQYIGLRTSDNITRFITGLLFGFMNMILFYHLLLEE